VCVQILWTYYPRLVIVFSGVVMSAAVSCSFAVYHLMLAATNQTLNERHKGCYIATHVNCYDRGVLLNLCEELWPLWRVKSV